MNNCFYEAKMKHAVSVVLAAAYIFVLVVVREARHLIKETSSPNRNPTTRATIPSNKTRPPALNHETLEYLVVTAPIPNKPTSVMSTDIGMAFCMGRIKYATSGKNPPMI